MNGPQRRMVRSVLEQASQDIFDLHRSVAEGEYNETKEVAEAIKEVIADLTDLAETLLEGQR